VEALKPVISDKVSESEFKVGGYHFPTGPQIKHQEMKISVPHKTAQDGTVDLIGNPINLSHTPVSYRYAPPTLGQHTDEVLMELLGLSEDQLENLHKTGLISS